MNSLSPRIYKEVAPTALGAWIPFHQPGGLAEISRGKRTRRPRILCRKVMRPEGTAENK